MPQTSYGLEYESTKDEEPGRTLTGGSANNSPVLADQVTDQLIRVDGDIAGVAANLAAVEQLAGKATVVGDLEVEGMATAASFTLPGHNFRHLAIAWHGSHGGSNSFASLGLRINGDGGNNYQSQRIAFAPTTGTWNDDLNISGSGTFSLCRVGLVGSGARSSGLVWIPDANLNRTRGLWGICMATRDNNMTMCISGGRYLNTTVVNSVHLWPSGEQWGAFARITLLGWRV